MIVADSRGNLRYPGEVISARQCAIDMITTIGANEFHPPSDKWILPPERLHVAPQTISGLHAGADDLAGKRAPLRLRALGELAAFRACEGIYRTPTTPHQPVDQIEECQLGPVSYQRPTWPQCIFESPLKYPLHAVTAQEIEERRVAAKVDGSRRTRAIRFQLGSRDERPMPRPAAHRVDAARAIANR